MPFMHSDLQANGKPGTINVLDQVPSEPYVWQKVPEGQHRIQVVLWKPTSAMDATSQPKAPEDLSSFDCSRGRATVDIIVRRFEDFMPSYDWKPVERWYQLPPGLEISMDLSGEAKRAKIPEPWKWQVEIIGEGAEMIEVRRDSTMSELLEKMKLSDSTHEVVFCDPNGKHEISLKPDWTAQQADLFRYRDQVQVRRFASIVD